jgi:hypothetical protein
MTISPFTVDCELHQLARLDGADVLLHPQQLRRGHRGRAQRLRQRLAVLHSQRELDRRIDVPVEPTGIGSKGDLYSGLQRVGRCRR